MSSLNSCTLFYLAAAFKLVLTLDTRLFNTGVQLLNRVNRWFSQAQKSYTESDEFIMRVQEAVGKVRLHPSKVWVWTKDLFQEIKAYREKPDMQAKLQNDEPDKKDLAAENTDKTSAGESGASTSEQMKQGEESNSTTSGTKLKKVSSKQIARLEALLADHSREIERYENMELSLDDLEDEDNSYMIAARLKKRANKIFERLCELKNRSMHRGGARERPFKYSGSRYTMLNKHIRRFINKQEFDERMPDYSDIKKLVTRCNTKYEYRLNKTRVAELAKEVCVSLF